MAVMIEWRAFGRQGVGRQTAAAHHHLTFLSELVGALQELQARKGVSAEERGRYSRWIEQAGNLEALLTPGIAADVPQPAGAADYSDLPPALLKELSIRRQDQLGAQILSVLRNCGGTADLDQVLVGLYRQHNTVQKRRFVQNKLWRMVRKGQIAKAKNTRNIFSLHLAAPKHSRRHLRRGKQQASRGRR